MNLSYKMKSSNWSGEPRVSIYEAVISGVLAIGLFAYTLKFIERVGQPNASISLMASSMMSAVWCIRSTLMIIRQRRRGR